MPAKANWLLVKSGPGVLTVNIGITRINVANAVSTASAELVPSLRKDNS